MLNLRIKDYLKSIFIVCLISIIIAYFIEFILGHQPCNLCLIERVPYVLGMILIILNHFFQKNEKFIILLLIIVFSFSFIVSFYHFGIEQNFFEESAVCGIQSTSEIVSKEKLLEQLQTKTTSCKDVTLRIFGFSLTTLNIILSLILISFLVNIFKNYDKFKK